MSVIYHYKSTTGLFIGTATARENPLSSGNYLVPANATDMAPSIPTGKVGIFTGGSWTYQQDYSGTYYYTKNGFSFTNNDKLSEPVGATTITPPSFNQNNQYASYDGSSWTVHDYEFDPDYQQFLFEFVSSSYYANNLKGLLKTSQSAAGITQDLTIKLGLLEKGVAGVVTTGFQSTLDELWTASSPTSAQQTELVGIFSDTYMENLYSLNF